MVLRVIHIFSGVFWVGFSLFNIFFLQPTVRATGAEGQKIMQYLSQKTSLLPTVYVAATLTVLSGLTLYWHLYGFQFTGAFSSGYGITLTIGGISALIAWFIAVLVISGIFRKMKTIGLEIQAQGGPPTVEQKGRLQAQVVRLGKVGNIALLFLIIALLAMSVARYASF